MTIRILAPATVTVAPETIVSVDDRVAARLIASGKAERVEEPKPARKTTAKKAEK